VPRYFIDPYHGVPVRELGRVVRMVQAELGRVFGRKIRPGRDREGNITWEPSRYGRLSLRQILHRAGPWATPVPTGRLKLHVGYPGDETIRPRGRDAAISEREVRRAVEATKWWHDYAHGLIDRLGRPTGRAAPNPRRPRRRPRRNADGAIRFKVGRPGRPTETVEGLVDTLAQAKEFAGALLVAVGRPAPREVRWFWGEREWRAFPAPGRMVGYQYRSVP
jgi:hypothetical protein